MIYLVIVFLIAIVFLFISLLGFLAIMENLNNIKL